MYIPLLLPLFEIVALPTPDIGAATRASFYGASSQLQGSSGRFYHGSGGK